MYILWNQTWDISWKMIYTGHFFFPIDNDDDAIIYFALFSVNAANWSNGICQESRMGNSCTCCSNTTGQENQRGGIC